VTLRARIWILLLTAAVLVLIAAVALRSGYNTVANTTNDVTGRLQPAAQGVSSLNTALAEMDSGVTAYALTGDVTDLSSYVEGTARADAEFLSLRTLLDGQPRLSRLLRDTQDAYRIWKRQGTRPIIEATRSGDRIAARALVRTGTSRNLYNDVRTFTHALEDQIRIRTEAAAAIQEEQFVRLSRIVNISILGFFGLLMLFSLLLLRGVLKPLRELQDQLVDVAQEGHHEEPIVPSGPPELRDVGQDAETMRRTLTREVDRARQADEGLAQQRPVVAAIRAELADSHSEPVTGIDFAGVQEPAEGVLAGDWWSAQVLYDGQLAITLTDVSGHGPEAGMEALRLKHVLELSLAQDADPALALTHATEGFRTASRFATCMIVVIEPQTGFLTWANAGHPPAWLITDSTTTELVRTGPLLSVLGGTWTNQHTHLDIGALLLLWTDGLTESHDEQRQELGEDGLAALVADAVAQEETSDGIIAHLLAAARARSVDWRRDDVTCVAVRRV
jgi:sigma-B regulation protein RsbU (phosphoserine phosphatase)